jgi:valyl-tRNA synthetase
MENIKDWCISRQLWWGHRIPAWYDDNGNFYVAENEAAARLQAARQSLQAKSEQITDARLRQEADSLQLFQDEDCLDTWFSSWLWPFEVFKGYSNPGNADVKYYYPTATLVTAPEIIFFWVARMIMAGLQYEKQIPFRDVYFTGIVRDEKGRKMSKSLGNSPDLLSLIDKYGADAVRFGIMISSPAGNDLLFDVKEESTLKQGSFFVNKMWNALKLIKLWEERGIANAEAALEEAFEKKNWPNYWFAARLEQAKIEINNLLDQFRLSEALKTLYSLIWDDYCSWYLEWIKPEFGEPINGRHFSHAIGFFDELLLLLHPFMPFITEEIYHSLQERAAGDDLCIKTSGQTQAAAEMPIANAMAAYRAEGDLLKQVITTIRDVRNKQQLKPKDQIDIAIETAKPFVFESIAEILGRQVNAKISLTNEAVAGATVVAIESDKFFVTTHQQVDSAAQKTELLKDLEYQRQFLDSVSKKLANERFVQNAKPEVVDMERKKKADAEARIRTIEESLQALG